MLETLHILDISQGLNGQGGAVQPVAALEKQKQRRLPNIIEQAPSTADKQASSSDQPEEPIAPAGIDTHISDISSPIVTVIAAAQLEDKLVIEHGQQLVVKR